MKRITLLWICCLCLFLGSCSYNKTQAFRACFTQACLYQGQLTYNQSTQQVELILLEDGSLRLRFTDGPLSGLEKHLSPLGETDVYQGISFPLAAPGPYSALFTAFGFLSQQHYTCNSRDAVQAYEFTTQSQTLRVCLDPVSDQLVSLELSDPQNSLKLEITHVIKESYATIPPTSNLGGDPNGRNPS